MLLFQFDCPALLAGCGPPDRVGKSLFLESVCDLTSSAHVFFDAFGAMLGVNARMDTGGERCRMKQRSGAIAGVAQG
jgi:hypothetical protein